jgi:hypothetical protein
VVVCSKRLRGITAASRQQQLHRKGFDGGRDLTSDEYHAALCVQQEIKAAKGAMTAQNKAASRQMKAEAAAAANAAYESQAATARSQGLPTPPRPKAAGKQPAAGSKRRRPLQLLDPNRAAGSASAHSTAMTSVRAQ